MPYECEWASCTAQFDNKEEILPHLSNLHMSANHLKPKKSQEDLPQVQCKWSSCAQDHFNTVDDLIKHISFNHLTMSLEEMESPNLCFWRNCGQRFRDFESLTVIYINKSHAAEFHVGTGMHEYNCEWYKCDRAGKPFTQRQKMMRHLQTHTGDKPYQCVECLQRFSDMVAMNQHKRIHTGEKPYKCEEVNCGKEFSIPSALTIHKRIHTGEKPYQCTTDGCEKRFADSSNLSKHLRVHTKEKPFQCPQKLCDKKFARSGQAARHAKVHRGAGTEQEASMIAPDIHHVMSQVSPEVQLAMSSLLQN